MLDVLGVVVEGLRCGVGERDVFGVRVVVGGDDGVAGEVVIVRVARVVYGIVIFISVVIRIAGEADNAGVVKLDVAGLLVVVAIRLVAVVVAVIVVFTVESSVSSSVKPSSRVTGCALVDVSSCVVSIV